MYQLRHAETGSWLCVESLSAMKKSHTLQVVLVNQEHSSRHCLFRHAPRYRTTHAHDVRAQKDACARPSTERRAHSLGAGCCLTHRHRLPALSPRQVRERVPAGDARLARIAGRLHRGGVSRLAGVPWQWGNYFAYVKAFGIESSTGFEQNPVLLSILTDPLARSSIKHLRVNFRCLIGRARVTSTRGLAARLPWRRAIRV